MEVFIKARISCRKYAVKASPSQKSTSIISTANRNRCIAISMITMCSCRLISVHLPREMYVFPARALPNYNVRHDAYFSLSVARNLAQSYLETRVYVIMGMTTPWAEYPTYDLWRPINYWYMYVAHRMGIAQTGESMHARFLSCRNFNPNS